MFPFVSRAALERATNASWDANQRALTAEGRLEAVEEALRVERARYDVLMESYKALRERGAVELPKPPETPPYVPAPPDELKQLIAAKCGSDLKLRGLMLRQLEIDRAAGVKDHEIEQGILTGIPSDGVPA